MRKSIGLLIISIIILPILLIGCWNYREINKLSIVTGFAIDKSQNNDKYIITAEIIDFGTGGRQSQIESKIVESEGETMLEAIRNMLQLSGNRLYWGHSKIIIVSEEIAQKGLSKVLDLIFRDAEVRLDMYVLVSRGTSAKEIFLQKDITSNLVGYKIKDMIESQRSLGKEPIIQIYQYISAIAGKMAAGVLPVIRLNLAMGKMTPKLEEIAIFKNNRLVGYLEGDDTMFLIFVLKQFNKGVIVQKEFSNGREQKISLEVFDTKTKITPKYESGKLSMDINISIDASIAELETAEDFIEESKYKQLEKDSAVFLQEKIKDVIKKVQNKFDADIFGFQKYIKANKPSVWNSIKVNWDEVFREIPVNVDIKIKLRNSGLASKPIKAGGK